MAQAAPLAGLHCPMVAVPRSPRAAARKLRLLSARTAGRRPIEPTSVGSSAGKHRMQQQAAGRAADVEEKCAAGRASDVEHL